MALDEWMDGWVGGWMDGRAGLTIAYSNQKVVWQNVWMDEWVGGCKIHFKDCLQQKKI